MGCTGAETKENCILAEFEIDEENCNKEVLIIGSTESFYREIPKDMIYKDEEKILEEYKDEKEISQCSIRVNDALIPFCYKYKFQAPGTYRIKYTFPKALTQTSFMFNRCICLKRIDLSNFDTSNLTKARGMFQDCTNLESFKFFNSPIEKVNDMISFFSMNEKLKNISLSNFNKEITVNMKEFFYGCNGLETVDLSKFKAKITSAEEMFFECTNIKKIDLSGLTSTKESKLTTMFDNMSSMEKKNLITKDQNILDAFDNKFVPTHGNRYRKEHERNMPDGEEGEEAEGGEGEGGGYAGEGMIEGDFIPVREGEEGEEGEAGGPIPDGEEGDEEEGGEGGGMIEGDFIPVRDGEEGEECEGEAGGPIPDGEEGEEGEGMIEGDFIPVREGEGEEGEEGEYAGAYPQD